MRNTLLLLLFCTTTTFVAEANKHKPLSSFVVSNELQTIDGTMQFTVQFRTSEAISFTKPLEFTAPEGWEVTSSDIFIGTKFLPNQVYTAEISVSYPKDRLPYHSQKVSIIQYYKQEAGEVTEIKKDLFFQNLFYTLQ